MVFLKSSEITNVYIHSRVWYDIYHMPFVRKVVDNLDSRVVLDSRFFRADSTLTHVTIQVTQLRLNSTRNFS